MWLRNALRHLQFLEFNSETWNTSSENVYQGATHFELGETEARGPRYTSSRKTQPKRSHFISHYWLRNALLHLQFLEFNSETWNTSSENVDQGATHFELGETEAGGPRYTFLR